MKSIRTLVVDDSDLIRELICTILDSDDNITVVGEAVNGREAIRMVRELKPDIVTMDIAMPVMDGHEAIERIMAHDPVPILVVTGKGDADTAYNALLKGALEVIPKEDVSFETSRDFIEKVKLLSKVSVITHMVGKQTDKAIKSTPKVQKPEDSQGNIFVIASSTGGPKALSVILPSLQENFPCPLLIAQHIQNDFVSGLVDWLDNISSIKVKLGEKNEKIAPATAYLSPADKHMIVEPGGIISFAEIDPEDIYHPSCNRLLTSVANVYEDRSIGVILTGMGDDGVEGLNRIKLSGGGTIAQDESTSAIFGMPKVAIDRGIVDKVVPLPMIGKEIARLAKGDSKG